MSSTQYPTYSRHLPAERNNILRNRIFNWLEKLQIQAQDISTSLSGLFSWIYLVQAIDKGRGHLCVPIYDAA